MVASLNKGEEKAQGGEWGGEAKVSVRLWFWCSLGQVKVTAKGKMACVEHTGPAHLSTALRMWAIQAFLSSLELV